jgi:outer membrane protein
LLADFGEREANLQAEALAFLAAGWQSAWSIQKVMAQVFEDGYSTIAAQDTLEALQISLADAKEMLEAANSLNEAGLSPISDVYSSKAALAQIQIEVAEQKATLEIQRAKLATTLGLEADAPLILQPLDALAVPQQGVATLMAMAREQRQDLRAQRARVAEAMARKRKVAAKYNPKLALSASGGAEHAVNDRAASGNYQIALNLQVPLFTGFDAIYQNRMASADLKISEENLHQLQLEIALEVLTQSSRIKAGKEMLLYARDSLDNAEAAYVATLEKYNAGKERIAEVSIALRQIVTARVRYSEINARYLVALANLAFATGTLLPPMEYPCIKR